MVKKRVRLHEGATKTMYEGPKPGTLIQSFRDDIRLPDGKTGVIDGKGAINNRISSFLMSRLSEIGVHNHFIHRLNMREQLVGYVEILPIALKVRNFAAGSFCTRFGVAEGTQLPRSIIEMHLKSDELGDPMVTEEHITAFGWAYPEDLDDMVAMAIRVNDYLSGMMLGAGLKLVDMRLEFGWFAGEDQDRIILADEITPDSCRLWDANDNRKLGGVDGTIETYQEIAKRLGIIG